MQPEPRAWRESGLGLGAYVQDRAALEGDLHIPPSHRRPHPHPPLLSLVLALALALALTP